MGCCFSTTKSPQKYPNHPNLSNPNHHHFASRTPVPESEARHSRAPPAVDEERVKEVLSETPFFPRKPESPTENGNKIEITPIETKEEKIEMNNGVEKSEEVYVSEISQISEMYSVSESFSTATSVTEKRDDEVMSKPRGKMGQRVNRSPAKEPRKRQYTGEVAGGRESRGRRTGSVRGREMGQVKTRQRNVVGSGGIRRDSGEISGRRSRSPATRVAGGGGRAGAVKTPMKGTGTAGGRSVEGKKVEGLNDGVLKEELNDGVLKEKESIDNPLVSLECFIFL